MSIGSLLFPFCLSFFILYTLFWFCVWYDKQKASILCKAQPWCLQSHNAPITTHAFRNWWLFFGMSLQQQTNKILIYHTNTLSILQFMFIGDRPFDLNLKREQSTIHVYEKDQLTRLDDDNRIRFVGNVTHAGHMKQVLSEEDKRRVRSITEQTEKEKNARSIELLDAPRIPTPTKLYNNSNTSPTTTVTTKMPSPSIKRNKLLSPSTTRPSPSSSSSSKLKASVNTTTSSPSGATASTATASTTGASSSAASRLEGAALAGLRERLIHLLALDHRPTDQLMQMLKVASVDLLPLLKKVSHHF